MNAAGEAWRSPIPLVQVFDDIPAAHHHPHVVRVGENAGVPEWISVEDDDVSALALFNGADLLLNAHQGRVRPGCRDDRVHRPHDTRLAGDLFAFFRLPSGQYLGPGSGP